MNLGTEQSFELPEAVFSKKIRHERHVGQKYRNVELAH